MRNFKVMKYLFLKPMEQQLWISPEFVRLLFPNLEEMIQVHGEDLKKTHKTSAHMVVKPLPTNTDCLMKFMH